MMRPYPPRSRRATAAWPLVFKPKCQWNFGYHAASRERTFGVQGGARSDLLVSLQDEVAFSGEEQTLFRLVDLDEGLAASEDAHFNCYDFLW